MKKLLLIPALLVGSLAMAQNKFEISPMVGYNFAEGNLNIKDDGYPVYGLEIQANSATSNFSPEFSFLYSEGVDYKTGSDTKIMRGAFNGVYTFKGMDAIVPFAKVGAGYEGVSNDINENKDGFFVDAGAGLKVPFTDWLALKLEAIYMAKLGNNNAGFADSNLVTMAGLTFSFGAQEQKAAPVVEEEEELLVVVVDGDDDNDGVLNSMDKCPATLAGVAVDASGCALDSDKDGVIDANDKCPNTPVGTAVDASGCALDSDKDGVINAKDLCPNTRLGDKVNSDGCPQTVALDVNFANDSATVPASAEKVLNSYADFLTTYTNYTAQIVGYTDDRGSASYNQKLSEKRAKAVMKDLIERGVDSKQLSAIGKGEVDPVADNATEDGRAKNRRIEAQLTRN